MESSPKLSSFGFSKNSDITLKENFHIDSKNFLKAKFKKEDVNYSLRAIGEHMALNTLPALLTCDITNNPIDKFLIKLSQLISDQKQYFYDHNKQCTEIYLSESHSH